MVDIVLWLRKHQRQGILAEDIAQQLLAVSDYEVLLRSVNKVARLNPAAADGPCHLQLRNHTGSEV